MFISNKKHKIIIGLVGEIASGKGTVVKYLKKKYQVSSCRFSDSLRDVLNRLYLEINRNNLQKLSQILRQNFGENLLAKVIVEDIKNNKNKFIIIDGVRRIADIENLKQLPEFKLIYITADIKTRYNRLTKREENKDDKNKTFQQFLKDNQVEAELEILKVSRQAHYKIYNNGNFKELYKQIDKIIYKVIKL